MRVQSGKIAFAAFAALTLAISAKAADLAYAPASQEAAQDRPVALGTGWYLRGDLNVDKVASIPVSTMTLPRSQSFPNSLSMTIGAGYKYNDWLRTDLTLDWQKPRNFSAHTMTTTCITGWHATSGTTEAPFTDNCSDYTQARVNNLAIMFNGYLDLGTWAGFTPYVGAGVGANYTYSKLNQRWWMSNGVPYQVTTPDALTSNTWYYNWDAYRIDNGWHLAWAAMAGVSYAVTPNMSLDLGYRYANLGTIQSGGLLGALTTSRNTMHSVRLGFRYTPDL
ncbi:MAG: porin family protein [Hyphomicrobiales bacterium]|nr:porin family protein [Hyphomicrobiales bacterium]